MGDVVEPRREFIQEKRIGDGMGESIPYACQDWANTKAAGGPSKVVPILFNREQGLEPRPASACGGVVPPRLLAYWDWLGRGYATLFKSWFLLRLGACCGTDSEDTCLRNTTHLSTWLKTSRWLTNRCFIFF
jgi:hypothetical protein